MNEHPLNALPQGYRLQEYELVRVLGFGGFGVTYLGYDHNLEKPVAIKEYLPTDIAIRTDHQSVAPQASTYREDYEWGLERFLDEARTLARFDHRNIIKVYRFFEANGTAYIVMEYAEGETFAAYLSRKSTLDEDELKRILLPVLEGLETVHRAEFLHRDIKPSNIVIRDEDASPVLIDFGAARHAVGARSRSVTTIVTPGYAPIEQYSSRGKQGPWTDVYALGAVCYKALTGKTPVDSIDRLNDDPLDSVSNRCADKGSGRFLKAIDWALNVKEVDRPQTIVAWKASISKVDPKPAKITPLSRPNPQLQSLQTKMTRSQWTVVIVFFAIVIFSIVIAIQRESEQKAEQARQAVEELVRERQARAAESARPAATEAERERWARAAARLAASEAEQERQAYVAEATRLAAERAEAELNRQALAAEEARQATVEAERERQARATEAAKMVTEGSEQERQTTQARYITLGTHKDDVLRLQGTPSSIDTRSTVEVLHYGLDRIRIDRRTGRVTEWSNFTGALKVRLNPGN